MSLVFLNMITLKHLSTCEGAYNDYSFMPTRKGYMAHKQ